MPRVSRFVSFVVLTGVALFAIGCGNKDKVVGKWKMVSMTKDGKEEKAPPGSDAAMIEFTADGNINLVMDTSNLPPELKAKLDQDKETAEKMKKGMVLGKYTISGDEIEVSPVDKPEGGGLFGGKKEKGKLKMDGDTMTITSDEGTLKLSRVK